MLTSNLQLKNHDFCHYLTSKAQKIPSEIKTPTEKQDFYWVSWAITLILNYKSSNIAKQTQSKGQTKMIQLVCKF